MSTLVGTTQYINAHAVAAGKTPAVSRNATKDDELRALMRAAQDGDRSAYASLLQQVLPVLKRVVQSRLPFLPHADREDLVQDMLLSLHTARATYDPERPFTPWLMTIAHNRMVDNARRQSRRFHNEVLVDEYPHDVADEDAGAHVERYGDPEALRRAVKTLPKGQRTAIELLKLGEMSLKEAAQVSGMSISALKVSVHRAIKSLRISLEV